MNVHLDELGKPHVDDLKRYWDSDRELPLDVWLNKNGRVDPFQSFDAQDRKHRADMGQSSGYIHPGLSARADTLADAMQSVGRAKPILEGRYLVKGWLDRGASSVVYGESNVGKTFFAMDMAMHVAAGLPWHGAKTESPLGDSWVGKVYYLALEGGSGFNNRVVAICNERPDILERIEGEGDFVPWPVTIDLHGPTDGLAIVDAINANTEKTALVVIDTLARAMGSGDENTAKDMGQLVANVDLIRERTGAHVMVIHHSGKDASKGARGSGSLRGAVDTEIELTRSGDVVTAETRKQRDMPCGSIFAYTLRTVVLGRDEDGDEVTSAVVVQTDAPAKRPKRLQGQALIAMKALEQAMSDNGVVKHGDPFPANRQCVTLEQWRDHCDRMSLSSGEGESSKRTAFHKVKTNLQNKEIVCIQDGHVWRVADE